jgi:hypothetical protein
MITSFSDKDMWRSNQRVILLGSITVRLMHQPVGVVARNQKN